MNNKSICLVGYGQTDPVFTAFSNKEAAIVFKEQIKKSHPGITIFYEEDLPLYDYIMIDGIKYGKET